VEEQRARVGVREWMKMGAEEEERGQESGKETRPVQSNTLTFVDDFIRKKVDGSYEGKIE